MSHSTRGAWIETRNRYTKFGSMFVALHEGCVDRNTDKDEKDIAKTVALHEGCVDRNAYSAGTYYWKGSHSTRGAWIETNMWMLCVRHIASHSTRGAWIETTN